MARRSFEEVVLPHLDAAFNYARWLTRSEADAEDVVQDACVRAFKFFAAFRGDDARPWLLTIVRNTWYGRFPRRAAAVSFVTTDDEDDDVRPDESLNPEALVIQRETVDRVGARSRSCQLISGRSSSFASSRGCRTRKSRRWSPFPW